MVGSIPFPQRSVLTARAMYRPYISGSIEHGGICNRISSLQQL
ncbi:hypothetical protein [Lacimicrobium alkaliphilum]|nr:hypothetical protein [Lacimicrobium alkaliphilum]